MSNVKGGKSTTMSYGNTESGSVNEEKTGADIDPKTGMGRGWKGGAPRPGDKPGDGWYGTGP